MTNFRHFDFISDKFKEDRGLAKQKLLSKYNSNSIKFIFLMFIFRVTSCKASYRNSTVYILLITLHANKSVRATATRPV
jgi:hypothetical protein